MEENMNEKHVDRTDDSTLLQFTPAVFPPTGNNDSLITSKDRNENHATAESQLKPIKYPKSVFFVLSNELCERFSYYGNRTILIFFLTDKLLLGDDLSTTIFHAYTMMVYFFPIFGAMIADSWLGKFKTIFYLSIVYAIGNATLSTASFPAFDVGASRYITCLALLFIAIGSGGIKPCVASFGGDQFILPQQERQLAQFFSIFYFCINVGSLISTFLTPIFREDVHCFGDNDCYPLAFGVPGVLMVTSLVIFLVGRPLYVIKEPTGNVVLQVIKCMTHAVSRRSSIKKAEKKDHWLDYADDEYDTKFIEDLKIVLRILILYVPLPIFWALFDQQGSRWTLQAANMNGEIGSFVLKPDQMQVINPFLILSLVPLFDRVLYPLCAKFHILTKPLTKILIGGLLAALAFIISGTVELTIEKQYVYKPGTGFGELRVYNGYNCPLNVNINGTKTNIESLDYYVMKDISVEPLGSTLDAKFICKCCETKEFDSSFYIFSKSQSSYYYERDWTGDISTPMYFEDDTTNQKGETKIRVLVNSIVDHKVKIMQGNSERASFNSHNLTVQVQLPVSKYDIHIDDKEVMNVNLKAGGVYVANIFYDKKSEKFVSNLLEVKTHNEIHMLWLLPQYICITMGEVMFSVTGLEFAYSQAPVSMKAMLQGFWSLTIAFGNLIVVIIAGAKISNSQAVEFFFFATLMVITMVIFFFLGRAYTYIEHDNDDTVIDDKNIKKLSGIDNANFKDDRL